MDVSVVDVAPFSLSDDNKGCHTEFEPVVVKVPPNFQPEILT